jgi:Mrp family chromosome partitioning ATPase/capsular polysaccharide biosynthesis protein
MDGHTETFEQQSGGGRYLEALREHWPYILATVVLALLAAALYVRTAENRYEAEADVLVTPVSGDTLLGIPVLREDGLSRSVVTAARLVRTPAVADLVKRRLQLPQARDQVRTLVDVTPQEQSNVLTITAEAATPDRAARVANAFALALVDQRTTEFHSAVRAAVDRLTRRLDRLPEARRTSSEASALSERLGDLQQLLGARDPTIRVVSEAAAPAEPVWPRPTLTLVVALVAGILLGMGIAVAIELLNPLVLRDRDLARDYGWPVLARMPAMTDRQAEDMLAGRRVVPAEAHRALRHVAVAALASRSRAKGPRTMLVTSAGRGEGKTLSAVNLAVVLASSGRSVDLVDGDVRRPRAAELAGGSPDATAGAGDGRLRVLEAHTIDAPLPLDESDRIEGLLDQVDSHADVIVFDAPSPTEDADALAIAPAVDAILVVVRLGRTRRDGLRELAHLLARQGGSIAGFIVVPRTRVWHAARRLTAPNRSAGRRRKPARASASA